jgi:ATP-dependent Clp protease ATP-binding subunit ClpB
VKKRLAKSDINFTWTDEAVKHISEIGYDPQFGARPVKRVIQNEVLNELSKDILSNKVSRDYTINLDYVDGAIVFENIVPEENDEEVIEGEIIDEEVIKED